MAEWTDEERAIAVGMKRAKMTNKAIAARLGRSVSSVKRLFHIEGVYRRLDHRPGGAAHSRAFVGQAKVTQGDIDDL